MSSGLGSSGWEGQRLYSSVCASYGLLFLIVKWRLGWSRHRVSPVPCSSATAVLLSLRSGPESLLLCYCHCRMELLAAKLWNESWGSLFGPCWASFLQVSWPENAGYFFPYASWWFWIARISRTQSESTQEIKRKPKGFTILSLVA